jgi:outer membrane protein assembly factor BamB
MTKKSISILLAFILLALALSGCTTGKTSNSWGYAAVDGDNVIFTHTNSVVALSTKNGSVRWTYPAKATASRLFFSAPTISEQGMNGDEQVLLGDSAGLLVSLSNNDGSTVFWSFSNALGKYIASPLIVDNMVIAPNTDGFVYFIKLSEDKSGWTMDSASSYPERKDITTRGMDSNALDAFWANPVSDGTTVYVPNMNHTVYAIDIASATEKWSQDLGGPLVAQPLLSEDGILYVGTLNSQLYALNAADGRVVWHQTLTGGIWSEPVLKDGNLFIGDESGKVTILNAADGSIIDTIDKESSVLGRGIDLGDSILFADEAGDLFTITATGDSKVLESVTGKIYSNLVYDGTQLYVLPTDGDQLIHAFDTEGNEIWNYSGK